MAATLRVAVEHGPKGRKVAAWALDWPGLQRGGRDERATLDALAEYRSRYAAVVSGSEFGGRFHPTAPLEVVERYEGSGMTDHYGISFASTEREKRGIPADELGRKIDVLEACWDHFDQVRGAVSAALARGPRGGGRDRDQIVRHVVYNEMDWAWKVGGPKPPKDPSDWAFDERELAEHRRRFVNGLRTFHADGRDARTWTLSFLLRHSAYHTMDHAWEMQDKDLSQGA